ncbi:SHOCT domain-containing protein [Clostridium sporogenes]|uniref:SHOCT domain-containing protein n=1 Tax=Clostridium sporogenes TaxID=1509 RepID=UPI0013D87D3F|nr:SHOCT domain-containing protein [Clostridium sporogenes]MCW6094852.1 SHOCT domain-containing protein [Clostridium sporogenes]NFG95555.1 SHOCT domain-containing protein [Clostridium sporogenes]NFH31550.1 SHOCT domain-containing protein [Clostridium sporogenes]NFL18956.1 SHOCT domain-containing protein [Clostridium sporogenes]NFN71958.1 SHOCT domain-containing protein [Clostridium sporogenes]
MALLKAISVPTEQRKKTTLASNLYYDVIEIHQNRVIGYLNGNQTMTWYFKDYNGIDMVKASMNSQFAQVVFLTGINSKNRVVGIDLGASQNRNAMNDTNRILFCSGMFSFGKTNKFANTVACEIRKVFENYKTNSDEKELGQTLSVADEIKKFKDLLDSGIISQEEFDTKKKQLLAL